MKGFNAIINLLFPPVCGFCNSIDKGFLCEKCKEKLDKLKESKITKFDSEDMCFEEHFYMFKYGEFIRDNIINYKFNEKSYLYKSFSNYFVSDSNFLDFVSGYDCIISVPVHKNRMKVRGYNQSELIAREIAKFTNKTYYNNVLEKNKNIVAQSTLNKDERKVNIKDAFCADNLECVVGKKVIIIDDIFTTGATVNECARMLKNAEVREVGVVTIAKD